MLNMQQVDGMASSFEPHKSTKGASKMRRDLINSEIANLRDLLPLPSSTRQRLSQLQLMALVCVYIRKSNYFQQVFKRHHELGHPYSTPNIGFSKALSGFLIMMTQNGKLLYISDNAAEYLGHSMEDLLIHGDSVYDIIDKADHGVVQTELLRSMSSHGPAGAEDTRLFLCRMNVSRNARRQMRFGDQKVVLVEGHYVSYLPLCSRNEPVFIAVCTPVAMPETRECVVQGATNVFTSIHSIDMKFMHIDRNGEHYLGYSRSEVNGLSWYQLIHWSFMKEAHSKHKLISQSDQEKSCILLLRLQTREGDWIWVHCVLQVKEGSDSSSSSSSSQQQQQSIIVATNQVLSEREAEVMRANSWIYHYYTVQTKLQYGLAYAEGTQAGGPGSPTTAAAAAAAAAAHRIAAATYFPTTKLVNATGHQAATYHHHHHHPHHLYHQAPAHPIADTPTGYAPIPLHSPAHQNGVYNPPYHPASFDLRNGKESPLDFSLTSAPPVYEFSSGYGSYWTHPAHYHGYHRDDSGSISTVAASATSPHSWHSAVTSNGGSSASSTTSHHHNQQQPVHHQASLTTTTVVTDTSPSSVIVCGAKRNKRMKKSAEVVGESELERDARMNLDMPHILGREGQFRSSRGYGGTDVLTAAASFAHPARPRKMLGSTEDESNGMEEESMTLACSLTPSPVWEGHNHRVPDLQLLRHSEREQPEAVVPPTGDLSHRVPNMDVWNAPGRLQFG